MLRYPSKAEAEAAGGGEGEEATAAAEEQQQSDDGSSDGGGVPTATAAAAAAADPSSSASASASSAAPGTPPQLKDVCKYFVNNTGHCLRGSECPKFHPPLALLPQYRTAWVQRRAAERALASHLEGDTLDPLQDKTHKAARARVRGIFLLSKCICK
jgi:hypothetical protein